MKITKELVKKAVKEFQDDYELHTSPAFGDYREIKYYKLDEIVSSTWCMIRADVSDEFREKVEPFLDIIQEEVFDIWADWSFVYQHDYCKENDEIKEIIKNDGYDAGLETASDWLSEETSYVLANLQEVIISTLHYIIESELENRVDNIGEYVREINPQFIDDYTEAILPVLDTDEDNVYVKVTADVDYDTMEMIYSIGTWYVEDGCYKECWDEEQTKELNTTIINKWIEKSKEYADTLINEPV